MIDLDNTSRKDSFEESIDQKLEQLLTKNSSEELKEFCNLYFRYEIYSYYKTLTNEAFTNTLNTFTYLEDSDFKKYMSALDEHKKEEKKQIILDVITQIKIDFEQEITKLKTRLKEILK